MDSTGSGLPTNDASGGRVRVLVVDDDPAIALPLARLLRREGFTVDTVGTGDGALRALDAEPDVIILDLGLPDTDGLDVCRQLRHAGHVMPVLILSARAGPNDITVGLDAGANDYVTKPFRPTWLITRLQALLPDPARAG